MFRKIARKLRHIADRIDPMGAPRNMSPYSFTFEQGKGIMFREDGKGCPLWYLGEESREKAWSEADTNWDGYYGDRS